MARTLINGSEQIAAATITASLLASGVAVTNLGYTPLNPANNLSDVTAAATARSNLGLTSTATTAIGTSGATVPLLSTANTWTLGQTFTTAPTLASLTGYLSASSGVLSAVSTIPISGITGGSGIVLANGTVSMTSSLNMGGFTVTNSASPVNASDLVIKSYVDAKIMGFSLHGARNISITNVALTGLQTIDGVTNIAGDLVLLTGQTTSSQNGPWVVASGAWTRPSWWSSASTVPEGSYFILDPDGTTYKNTKWWCNNTGTITVDTTAVSFVQDLSGTTYTNGAGLGLAGTTFSVTAGNGITTSSGVTAVGNATQLISVSASGIGITNGTAGQVIVANSSTNAAWATLSGDVTINSTGVTAVNNTSGSGYVKYTNYIWNETPGGLINGSNTTFTLANAPANSGAALELVLNGYILEPGAGNDYTVSGSTVTMLFGPATGDKLRAYYIK
jgi:hypothetical protein